MTKTTGIKAENGAADAEWQARIFEVWRYCTERYSAGGSTSVREEAAMVLLRSVDFTVNRWLRAEGISRQDALRMPSAEMYTAAELRLASDTLALKEAYERMRGALPKAASDSLLSTFAEIGAFFERYSPSLLSAQIPCEIDYQLAFPVSEERLGLDYISDYLSELFAECAFLSRFDSVSALRLLKSWQRDWKTSVLNLFEPVFACALGLSLLSLPPRTLMLTRADLTRLKALLAPLSEGELCKILLDGAERLAEELGLAEASVCASAVWEASGERNGEARGLSGIASLLRQSALALAPRAAVCDAPENIFIPAYEGRQ